MKSLWMSLLLALAIAVPAGAQDSGADEPTLEESLEYDPDYSDPILDDPYLDDSTLDDPVIDQGPGTVPDEPRRQRLPSDRKLTPEEVFAIMDTDGDGSIDQAEWRQQSMTVFYVRDADEDTILSRDEVPGLTAEAFDEMDLDGDGTISGYEFNQSRLNKFAVADADKDGGVTLPEFKTFLRQFTGQAG